MTLLLCVNLFQSQLKLVVENSLFCLLRSAAECIYIICVDIEKQRQRRHDNVRLTESARSEQLLVMPTESLTNREWLPGELLSGSECRRLGWIFSYEISDLFGYRCPKILASARIWVLLECRGT